VQPLLTHLLDVCGQASEYHLAYKPKCSVDNFARVLAYSALLHDFGKIHIDFQLMLKTGQRFANRHEILSLAFLEWLEAPEDELNWAAAAIATHHREMSFIKDNFPLEAFERPGSKSALLASGVREEDARLLHRLLSCAAEAFHQAGWRNIEPYRVRPFSDNYLNGIKAGLGRAIDLAARFEPRPQIRPGQRTEPDWPNIISAIHARGWLLLSDHLASFGRRSIGRSFVHTETVLHEIRAALGRRKRGTDSVPLSHQTAAANTTGSAVLAAPTGSGKTEASILWASRQAEAGLQGKTLIVLPYQASMNAMQRRLVEDFFPQISSNPEVWNENVALIHGRSVRRIYELLAKGGIEEEYAVQTANLQSQLARLNAAPLVICSAFSLIRVLFASKRAEELLASLWQARIVLDEVHAYETDVTAMTLAVLRFFEEQLGARSLLMSATVPSHLLSGIQEVLGTRPCLRPGKDVLDRPPRHRLHLLDLAITDRNSVELILSRASGASVLVVVNQVNRARNIFKRLRREGLDVSLLHGRFNYADRSRIEGDLRPAPGKVLIGTQAVEVSLDLDFDCCFTEIAPVESLWQRFGRVNRYGKGPIPADVNVFMKLPENERSEWLPYEKEHLQQVRTVLAEKAKQQPLLFPFETEIIDRSYPVALREHLHEALLRKTQEVHDGFVRGFRALGTADMSSLKALEKAWEDLFDGDEILPADLIEQARSAQSWIERSRYLVPISGKLFRRVNPTWCEDLKCFTVNLPYSSELGLGTDEE
jgi:CRISPR-associated endonuclease/helicase Cas3